MNGQRYALSKARLLVKLRQLGVSPTVAAIAVGVFGLFVVAYNLIDGTSAAATGDAWPAFEGVSRAERIALSQISRDQVLNSAFGQMLLDDFGEEVKNNYKLLRATAVLLSRENRESPSSTNSHSDISSSAAVGLPGSFRQHPHAREQRALPGRKTAPHSGILYSSPVSSGNDDQSRRHNRVDDLTKLPLKRTPSVIDSSETVADLDPTAEDAPYKIPLVHVLGPGQGEGQAGQALLSHLTSAFSSTRNTSSSSDTSVSVANTTEMEGGRLGSGTGGTDQDPSVSNGVLTEGALVRLSGTVHGGVALDPNEVLIHGDAHANTNLID
mmetsp:Transcript_1067/g.1955  ORF Transcript_1067/g.1955 Transcript_1067/m.1955 type:complete len:326 (-) Transcript_1067:621-1598(-)